MSAQANDPVDVLLRRPSRLAAVMNSDLVYSFLHSRITIGAAIVTLVIFYVRRAGTEDLV